MKFASTILFTRLFKKARKSTVSVLLKKERKVYLILYISHDVPCWYAESQALYCLHRNTATTRIKLGPESIKMTGLFTG